MSRSSVLALGALIALAAPLAGCGGPKELPVQAKQCDTLLGKNSVLVSARIYNGATKPVKGVRVSIDYYTDFRFQRVLGSGTFAKELDPGKTATTTLTMNVPAKGISGRAQRCEVVHVDYLDGTTADLPQG